MLWEALHVVVAQLPVCICETAQVEGEEELGVENETNTDKASELQRVSLQLATEAEEASSKAVLAVGTQDTQL